MKKLITVGVILLFLGMTTTLTSYTSVIKAHPSLEDSVTFNYAPANGLYWNGYKIANYSVPLFIHLKGGFLPQINFNITGDNISKVEIWVGSDIRLQSDSPPFNWYLTGLHLFPFSHSATYATKVYMLDGQIIWYNYTVYRLF